MSEVISRATPLRLLVVEDNPFDAELAVMALRRAGRKLDVVRVETRERFLEELERSPDLILCDYNMPTFKAPEALELLKQHELDIPFIILSGSIGEETAVEMIKSGADDYLLKDRIGRLDAAIEQALEQKALRDETRRTAEHLRQSEFKYRCLFDHLFDAVFLCDANSTRIIDTNREGERLLAKERGAILGTRLKQYFAAGGLDQLMLLPRDEPDARVRFDAELNGAAPAHGEHVKVNATPITLDSWRLLLVMVGRNETIHHRHDVAA